MAFHAVSLHDALARFFFKGGDVLVVFARSTVIVSALLFFRVSLRVPSMPCDAKLSKLP